jgi:hypothetical protein
MVDVSSWSFSVTSGLFDLQQGGVADPDPQADPDTDPQRFPQPQFNVLSTEVYIFYINRM